MDSVDRLVSQKKSVNILKSLKFSAVGSIQLNTFVNTQNLLQLHYFLVNAICLSKQIQNLYQRKAKQPRKINPKSQVCINQLFKLLMRINDYKSIIYTEKAQTKTVKISGTYIFIIFFTT